MSFLTARPSDTFDPCDRGAAHAFDTHMGDPLEGRQGRTKVKKHIALAWLAGWLAG